MNDSAGAQDVSQEQHAGCRRIVIHATPEVLWQKARDACEDALTQGYAFVAVLHEAEAFADEHLLTDEDRQRAARFRQAGDRDNFVLGRTMVHHLVAPRGASMPCAFSIGPHGKPFLPGAPAYNLSHSGRWVACVVSRHEPVGVDVETFARLQNYRDLIPTITHPIERHYIERAPSDSGLALFKRCWTRKEAILKATGKGLSDDLQSIDVHLDQDEPVLDHPARLRLIHLPVSDAQATGALAVAPSVRGVVAMLVAGSVRNFC